MHSPPLQLNPVSTTHYFVCGDVTIHAGAAIAPGALLQADPGSRIVIEAGACVGLGSIIHAHGGTISIGESAMVGAGVLVIGVVSVGDRACVGSATTVLNRSIAAGTIVPPGSLLTDQSEPTPKPAETATATEPEVYEPGFCPPAPQPEPEETDEIESPPQSAVPDPNRNGSSAYGQAYVSQLIGKIFPNQQRFNDSQEDPG